jgi:hypothetical protein
MRDDNLPRGIDPDPKHELFHQFPLLVPGKILFESRAQGFQ